MNSENKAVAEQAAHKTPRPLWSFLAGAGFAIAMAAALQPLVAPATAQAQLPDSAAQRLEMLTELRIGNQKLTEIAVLLREIRDRQMPPAKDAKGAEPGRK